MKRFLAPALLAVFAIALLATAIPAVFSIDEDSYIATIVGLRDGSLRVPGTADLPPSPELLSFDAAPKKRTVTKTPIASNFPPLYAVYALPFSLLGIYGLIALQVLAFVVCAWLVFCVVRRETARTDLAWLAMGTYLFGSFAIEYAQAIWPHALTMALVAAAVDLTSRVRHGSRHVLLFCALAGFFVGSAAGMRYQNIVLAGLVGATVLWLPRRKLAIAGFVLGIAIPIATSAAMNASRLGTWNPVSKGTTAYLDVGRGRQASSKIEDAIVSTWARVVDLSAWPGATHDQAVPKSVSGAFLLESGMKKALVQSSPWALLPLVALLVAWLPRARAESKPLLRGFSLVVFGVLGMFALWGFRDDGWSFNQRYLLELMPILCVGLAVALAEWKPNWLVVGAGALGGAIIAAVNIAIDHTLGGQILMLKLPIVIAVVATIAWLLRERARRYTLTLAATLGIGLGWAAVIHIADDLPASRSLRDKNHQKLTAFLRAVPDESPAAIVAYWGNKDSYGPLILDRDIVIIDPWIDGGRDAPMLIDRLLAQGRTVYVDLNMPRELLMKLVANRRVFQNPAERWMIAIKN